MWSKLKQNLQVAFPLLIATFAAILAINDLFGGKFGDDEIKLSNARNNSYQWYQAKGIKETILEGQIELLDVLLKSGSISVEKIEPMQDFQANMRKKVERYVKEKREILLGSSNIPEQEWFQEIDGKKGQVIGGKQYDSYLATLGEAGNYFDLASMLFQVCLVFGAIGIVIQRLSVQWLFFHLCLLSGLLGTSLGTIGLLIALKVPEL